ncbi:MAG: hypothetical protein KAG92_07540, partial [Deltaproteobacteria bacterium]|nr:hypothetical protein [Deltaproteobacteria bacterium]
ILKLWLSIGNDDNCKEKNASSCQEKASFCRLLLPAMLGPVKSGLRRDLYDVCCLTKSIAF